MKSRKYGLSFTFTIAYVPGESWIKSGISKKHMKKINKRKRDRDRTIGNPFSKVL